MELGSLPDFVKYGLTPIGAGTLLGIVLYFLGEMSPWYNQRSPLAKRWIAFGVSMALPTLLLLIWHYVIGENLDYNIVFAAYVAGATAFGSTTLTHSRELTQRSLESEVGKRTLQHYKLSMTNPYVTMDKDLQNEIGRLLLKGHRPFDKGV